MDIKNIVKKAFWPVFAVVFVIVLIVVVLLIIGQPPGGPPPSGGPGPGGGPDPRDLLPEPGDTASTAVKNLKSGWKEEMVYQHDIVYGSWMTKDNEGNILILSKGNNKILSLSKEGELSEYLDISNSAHIRTIAYQPNHDRLLIIERQLYAYSDGELIALNRLGGDVGVMEVSESDDSIYTCTQDRNQKINHYDADGEFISTIIDGVDGCSQMALDEANNKLYYSETYAGQISEIDLSDNSKKVIATGVGIPGTYEPISVAFDDKNTLYSFPGPAGLFEYQGGSFTKRVDSIAGAGAIIWSDAHSAFLQVAGVGANIISYNPASREAEHLTQYVNAMGIVETDDGTVLVCEYRYFEGIQKVDSSGFSAYIEDIGGDCQNLELDSDGNIYAGTNQGKILKVTAGSVTTFVSDLGFGFGFGITSLSFDSKNNAMVAVGRRPDSRSAEVWRIPLDTPESKTKVTELTDVMVHSPLPRAAVDREGNIYLLERKANTIYKIPDGSSTMSVFAANVLENEAITVPGIEYLSKEHALLISTITNFELWPIDNPVKSTFAVNTASPDNFGINENKDGDVIAIHSGEVFKFVHSP